MKEGNRRRKKTDGKEMKRGKRGCGEKRKQGKDRRKERGGMREEIRGKEKRKDVRLWRKRRQRERWNREGETTWRRCGLKRGKKYKEKNEKGRGKEEGGYRQTREKTMRKEVKAENMGRDGAEKGHADF